MVSSDFLFSAFIIWGLVIVVTFLSCVGRGVCLSSLLCKCYLRPWGIWGAQAPFASSLSCFHGTDCFSRPSAPCLPTQQSVYFLGFKPPIKSPRTYQKLIAPSAVLFDSFRPLGEVECPTGLVLLVSGRTKYILRGRKSEI